jgi:hypothetical protein
MRVRMLAAGALLALLVALLSPMAALAQAQTTTVHFSGTESTPDVNPCTGATGTLTETLRGVTHITELPDGTSHETTTATGTFTFVPDDPSQPTYTGHETFWDGENFTGQSFTATFTGHVNARGSDGSRITDHFVAHVTITVVGTSERVIVEFETERLSCP